MNMYLNTKLSTKHTHDKDTRQYVAYNIFQMLHTKWQKSKKISNDQELIQSDPTSCPQNQKGNN